MRLIKADKPLYKRPKQKKRLTKHQRAAGKPPIPNPYDEDYDGYYEDIMPADNGHTRDRLDPELIKRAVLIAAGAFVIIILSVFLMYVL